MMKSLTFLLLPLLLIGSRLQAQTVQATSKVTDVTAYRLLARETRTSLVNLPEGVVDVVISGVTTEMIDQSIQVSVKGDAVLQSAVVRTNYFTDNSDVPHDPRWAKFQDSLAAIQVQLRWIDEEQEIHDGELTLLNELLHSGAINKDYKPADLTECANIYRVRTMELKKKLFDLQLREEQLADRAANFESQLEEMGPKAQNPVKEIVLTFWSEIPGIDQIKCNYLVNRAGWVPMYDLNVENTSKPVAISYKAGVYQATGMDWKNVDLTISTANPGLNNDRPIMSPQYVDYQTYALRPADNGETNSMYIASKITKKTSSMAGAANGGADSEVENPYEIDIPEDEMDILAKYEIALKQTIVSDAKPHICKLKDYSVPATYRYHAVPKLQSAAFLLARITNYGQYNLLAGKANVFFGDTYVGEVDLNPQVTGDTLLVSLGRDENIVVKRVRVEDEVGNQVASGMVKENFEYNVTVRNNKSIPIVIEVLDQIPLSRRKGEITVKLEDCNGADYQENYGRILWQLKLAPSKSVTRKLKYTITYPEGKNIAEQ